MTIIMKNVERKAKVVSIIIHVLGAIPKYLEHNLNTMGIDKNHHQPVAKGRFTCNSLHPVTILLIPSNNMFLPKIPGKDLIGGMKMPKPI